jgi:hypothetical protein
MHSELILVHDVWSYTVLPKCGGTREGSTHCVHMHSEIVAVHDVISYTVLRKCGGTRDTVKGSLTWLLDRVLHRRAECVYSSDVGSEDVDRNQKRCRV